MGKYRLVKRQLKANPGFREWLEGKPDLMEKVKEDPAHVEAILAAWKKTQEKKATVQKMEVSYRYMVNQIQELNTLLQRVDQIVRDVRMISEKMNMAKNHPIVQDAPLSSKKKAKKVGKKDLPQPG